MSLMYEVAFPQQAPEVRSVLQDVIRAYTLPLTVDLENEQSLIVRQQGEYLLDVTVFTEADCYELKDGQYMYSTSWLVEFGKADPIQAMRFYVGVLGQLAQQFSQDFLAISDGWMVVLKKEAGRVDLNAASGVWDNPEYLAMLGNAIQPLANRSVV